MALVSRPCTLQAASWDEPRLCLVLGIWCIDVADEFPSAEVSSSVLRAHLYRNLIISRSSELISHPPSQNGKFAIIPVSRFRPPILTPPRVPPNCRFELDDMEEPWMWSKNSFDLIFLRDLIYCIRDWPKLIDQCYTYPPPLPPPLSISPTVPN